MNVLLVCTGNTCRSPMAEGLLKKLVAERGGDSAIIIRSAGTHAREGGPAAANSVRAMSELGIDIAAHEARRVTPELAAEADLILTLSQSHRSQLLQLDPALAGKVHVLTDEGIADPIGQTLDVYRECATDIEAALKARWLDKIVVAVE